MCDHCPYTAQEKRYIQRHVLKKHPDLSHIELKLKKIIVQIPKKTKHSGHSAIVENFKALLGKWTINVIKLLILDFILVFWIHSIKQFKRKEKGIYIRVGLLELALIWWNVVIKEYYLVEFVNKISDDANCRVFPFHFPCFAAI